MNRSEILESGLLEMYVLGAGTQFEIDTVEKALKDFPDLKQEIHAIEQALKQYALTHGMAPSPGLKSSIISKLKDAAPKATDSTNSIDQKNTATSYLIPFIISMLTALGLLGSLLYQKSNTKATIDQYEKEKIICDSIQNAQAKYQSLLADLTEPGIEILEVDATDKYPGTKLYIHNNKETKKNIIQLTNLPPIASNQSFQLWSLKEGSDPIPLDVFRNEIDLFEVQYVDGTNAYAITIESLGGAQAPTMDNLIGVIPVS